MFLLALLSAGAAWYVFTSGWTLYYGDAEAHLNIARRIVDSRTPGWDQIGTVWLPLPHALMVPFVRWDDWWQTGLAGVIPSAFSFVLAGSFLFLAARRILGVPAAYAAVALFALNPNVLYLQAIPMTEVMFMACFAAVFYFTVVFDQKQALWAAAAAGLAGAAGSLVRYEGWFVLPFAAAIILIRARRRRVAAVVLFCLFAGLGPLAWLAHNRWHFADALAFYRGPGSALAIQGTYDYPGKGDWAKALFYFSTAARLCCGPVLLLAGFAGGIYAVLRRAWWPIALLSLPPVFYILSMHSSGTPIFVPGLWPYSYYNTRYGLSMLPFVAFSGAVLVNFAAPKRRFWVVLALIGAVSAYWAWRPEPITWRESEVNSRARRAWTQEAARYLEQHYRPGSGIISTFGDLTGIFRTAGIPLREVLTGDNGPHWMGATARPDMFLWEEWAVAAGGDPVQTAINRANRRGPYYDLQRRIVVKHAPVIEIYRRR